MKRLETKYIVAIIISLILGASILGYGYLDYIYKKDALSQKVAKETQDEQIKIQTQLKLNTCLADVESRLKTALGDLKNQNLSNSGFNTLLDFFQKQKDECFKKYPLN